MNVRRVVVAVIFIIFLSSTSYGIETIIRVAYEPSLPPYQFILNDSHVGIHIDILNSIAKHNNFIIEYIPMKTTIECLEALENGKVDIILGVNSSLNLKHDIQLTENISQSYICIVAPNSKVHELENNIGFKSFKASLQSNTIKYSYIKNMRNLKYIVMPNQVDNFNSLLSNESDMLIGVKHSILYQLDSRKLTDDYTIINNYISPIEYAMAVKSGNNDLLERLNEGISQLRVNGEYEEIYDRWIDEEDYATRKMFKKIIIMVVAFSALLIIIIRFNRLLKRQVNEKTKELRRTNNDLENQIIETRNSNELNNCIVENSPSSIVAFDRNFIITIFNKNAYKLVSSDKCPIGKNILEIDLFNQILMDKKDRIFEDDTKIVNEEIVIKNANKEDVYYRYSIYQLFDMNNNVRGAILAVEDITEEIAVRQEIYEKEKNKALNQIIAGIAHEIRNPLMSIKTFAELIPTKMHSANFQCQFAEFVPKEVDRANRLIKNLIDYAKPNVMNTKEEVNIRELVDSCIVLVNQILVDKGIKLEISIKENLSIYANRGQVRQALINLIFNSIDSMYEKYEGKNVCTDMTLNISAWEEEQNVFMQVRDEGIGMTPEQIEKSVEPFFTTKSNGVGLGLWVSRQYIEKNDGTMIIESEVNKYTLVRFKFRRSI